MEYAFISVAWVGGGAWREEYFIAMAARSGQVSRPVLCEGNASISERPGRGGPHRGRPASSPNRKASAPLPGASPWSTGRH